MLKDTAQSNFSYLTLGNQALRSKEYEKAINLFILAKSQSPQLINQINFNIELAKRYVKPNLQHKEKNAIQIKKNELSIRPGYKYQLKIESLNSSSLVGWAVNTQLPGDIFDLEILVNGILFIKLRNDINRADLVRHRKSTGKGGFNLTFPRNLLNPGLNEISIRLPNDEIVKAGVVESNIENGSNNVPFIQKTNKVSIIVPIYNAIDDVRTCIKRLKQYTHPSVRIFLINDASSDPEIKTLLETTASSANFTVVHNQKNLGFTKTVNIGISLANRDDVVLLNSDARVTPRWLEGMQRALKSDYRIATVTAMSDRAGAFSAPEIGNSNELPLGVSEIEYARAFRRRARGLYPSVPTGNGFCMYIRRQCIDEIGQLDEQAFPRGYGEENDFCMRARAAGWQNIIDDRTYVFHDRSKSFGGEKQTLIRAGREIVDKRYPDYKQAIEIFSKSPSLAVARFSAKQAMLDCTAVEDIKPRALFVVATTTGGTPQTNRDLMLSLNDAWEPWLLHCDSNTISLFKVNENKEDTLVRAHRLAEPVDPTYHISYEYDRVVANWLDSFDFEVVHIRHLAWHSLSLPKLAKDAGSKVVYSFHDYYAACPTVKLLDSDGFFCGGDCSQSKAKTDCSNPLWPASLPPLKNQWIHQWRKKFENAISYVDEFITTSIHAKEKLLNIFNSIDANKFSVIPHGRDFPSFNIPKTLDSKPEKIKILVPGNIDRAKGGNYILDLIRHDKKALLEFHILGAIDEQFQLDIEKAPAGRIVAHGTYKRDDFVQHVIKISPHVGAVFSIWDETWCHTLTEIWASGLPALVLNYPTVGGRVKAAQAGWVLDRENTSHAFKIISKYVVKEHSQKLKAVQKWQESEGLFRNVRWMASQYHLVYSSSKESRPPYLLTHEIIAVVSPSNQSQTAAPGSTHIRLWENTRNSTNGDPTFCRMTPDQLVAGVELGAVSKAIIQRNALHPRHFSKLAPYIKAGQFSYNFEIDDNLLSVPTNIDMDGVYKGYRPTLKQVIKWAATVIVSTSPLAEEISKINPRTILVPNKISARIWKSNLEKEFISSPEFTAVYFGTKSHKEDYELILPALTEVAQRVKNFRLLVIGALEESYPTPTWVTVLPVPPINRNYPAFVQWLKEVTKHADVGLAPLHDTSFNNYKSNLKALEYAALGLPVLASKGSVYNRVSEEAPAIIAVDNSLENWVSALLELTSDKSKIFLQGEENKKWVFKNHSIFDNNSAYYQWS